MTVAQIIGNHTLLHPWSLRRSIERHDLHNCWARSVLLLLPCSSGNRDYWLAHYMTVLCIKVELYHISLHWRCCDQCFQNCSMQLILIILVFIKLLHLLILHKSSDINFQIFCYYLDFVCALFNSENFCTCDSTLMSDALRKLFLEFHC